MNFSKILRLQLLVALICVSRCEVVDVDDANEELEDVLKRDFSDVNKMYTFDEVEAVAIVHIGFDDLKEIRDISERREQDSTKLSEDEQERYSNYMLVNFYLKKKFDGEAEVDHKKVLNILDLEIYDKWFDELSDENTAELDKLIPSLGISEHESDV